MQAKLTASLNYRSDQRETARSLFATAWWVKHLRVQDFMPNDEYEIVYRGPPYMKVWEMSYAKEVTGGGGVPLSYKHWMLCVPEALSQLQRELGSSRQAKPLRLVRSANHSKFPECEECQRLRKAYLKVACNSSSSAAAVEAAAKEMEAPLLMHTPAYRHVCLLTSHCPLFAALPLELAETKCIMSFRRIA